jgi:hypothetical protein
LVDLLARGVQCGQDGVLLFRRSPRATHEVHQVVALFFEPRLGNTCARLQLLARVECDLEAVAGELKGGLVGHEQAVAELVENAEQVAAGHRAEAVQVEDDVGVERHEAGRQRGALAVCPRGLPLAQVLEQPS